MQCLFAMRPHNAHKGHVEGPCASHVDPPALQTQECIDPQTGLTMINALETTSVKDIMFELAPGVSIWKASIREIHSYGEGDHKVKLCIGDRTDGNGQEPFLSTNGGTILITEAGGDFASAVDDAAEELGLSVWGFVAMVREAIPGIDWSEPASNLIGTQDADDEES
jgi:hypothetical protein